MSDGDGVWSDTDESLLLQCDHNDGTEMNSATDKSCPQPCSFDCKTVDKNGGFVICPPSPAENISPLQQFHKVNYLCVTDLTQQLWCEQHLSYTMMGVEVPVMAAVDDAGAPLPLPVADRPEVKAGKSVHLARELELHDVIDVKISSRADKWALHILNLLSAVRGFLDGVLLAREVPIFGDPFGTGDMLFGIIDELRFDPETYSISLVELKTRKSKRMPGKSQKKQHMFQVLLYKRLWDNLVKGDFSADFFLSHLKLTASANQLLSEEIIQHLNSSAASASSLRELLSQLTTMAQALVCVGSVEIEYVLQETGSVIGRSGVEEDADWLWRTFNHCMDYWHGGRKVVGVEVEEAWKCSGCEYSPVCEWRAQKAALLSENNHCKQAAV